ncbi:YadN family fimbrial protein [Rahnella aquatilis CIP 78.65 = ATCC 33071]|uniref:P pilus assembly protein, pilin FimA n=1 Tax=Rahnella aquatilis (strain ATCC 33071 / DSM 4594 / JCM 1683 / NBRC 105701 / NCIMB 13365 / CIP 78.65) TaxID=745277 RepID=H2J121_RAHAC|nr:fimbrial protein [Rahnella aquatilis]AEX53399.1 P pilus assembly protein, pilin FimA [Rahnella aquatilis CIP 78.65 = ATCC 33071]KFD03513.1 YadN family fimbrial protein [Rahnella aquatilis CIP 78.65 = ATCC 33071]
MKKSTIFFPLSAFCLVFSGLSAQAADVGLITFDGAVSDTTCEITTNNGVAANNVTISLPVVTKAAVDATTLAAGGVGAKEFELMLNDCAASVTKATISFSSQQFAELSNGTLKPDSTVSGSAQNVSIALYNNTTTDVSQVLIGDPTDVPQSVTLVDGRGIFAYKTAYVPSADWTETNSVQSGKVNTNVTFTMAYE